MYMPKENNFLLPPVVKFQKLAVTRYAKSWNYSGNRLKDSGGQALGESVVVKL